MVEAELLENNNLNKEFARLDRFEGEKYQRELVPYDLEDNVGVANVYSKRLA